VADNKNDETIPRRGWERRTGVNRSNLNQAINGRRDPGPQIAAALQLKKVLTPNIADVRQRLQREVQKTGSQSQWARRTGVSRVHLNKVLNGKKTMGPRIIEALKLNPFVYVPLKDDED
jgi:DNA-binding transcriptional regulator YdaS (Cro superfamily)